MTLRRLAALTSYWEESPPTHVLVRALAKAFGNKRKGEAKVGRIPVVQPSVVDQAAAGSQVEQLMAMFPQSPFPIQKPMLPEEYLRLRKEARDGLQQ